MKIISEFAMERGVDRNAVTQYIRRHPEIFEGHTGIVGNSMVVDAEGEAALDKKYPYPKPVEVIEDTESRKMLIKAQQDIIELHKILNQMQEKLTAGEVAQALLEDRNAQLAAVTQERDQALRDRHETEEKLAAEQNRPLTWGERLTGRKAGGKNDR